MPLQYPKKKKQEKDNEEPTRLIQSGDEEQDYGLFDSRSEPPINKTRFFKHPDVNLPDTKKGRIVGYMDLLTDDFRPEMRQSRPIYGGDSDDPRWQEMEQERLRDKKKKFDAGPSNKTKSKLGVR